MLFKLAKTAGYLASDNTDFAMLTDSTDVDETQQEK